mgnify:CR=1 FL=1
MTQRNVGIIGSGISGLTAALTLKKQGHNVTLYEKNAQYGGHTYTHHFMEKQTKLVLDLHK